MSWPNNNSPNVCPHICLYVHPFLKNPVIGETWYASGWCICQNLNEPSLTIGSHDSRCPNYEISRFHNASPPASRVGSGCVLCTRIDLLRFLAGCRRRRLNQGLVVALGFFSLLDRACFCVIFLVYGCVLCLVCYLFVISTSVIDCLGRFASKWPLCVEWTLNLTKLKHNASFPRILRWETEPNMDYESTATQSLFWFRCSFCMNCHQSWLQLTWLSCLPPHWVPDCSIVESCLWSDNCQPSIRNQIFLLILLWRT